MNRLLVLGAIGILLAAFALPSSAAAKYSSSKSSTGNFVLSYSDVVTLAQAGAILADLEKPDQPVDEPGVRDILKNQGVQNDHIRKIIIEPGPDGSKGATILLLAYPADEGAARAAIDLLGAGKRKH
jgi:hypothetical protein